MVYIGGYNGRVYAVSSSTGALRWVYPREGNLEPIVGGVAVSQGKVYFGCSGGKVYALDATTGDMTAAGALTINAAAGITFNDSLTTGGAIMSASVRE